MSGSLYSQQPGISGGFGLRIDPLTGRPIPVSPASGFSPLAGMTDPRGQSMAPPNLQLGTPTPAQPPAQAPQQAEPSPNLDFPDMGSRGPDAPMPPTTHPFMNAMGAAMDMPPGALTPGQSDPVNDYVGARGLTGNPGMAMTQPSVTTPPPPAKPTSPMGPVAPSGTDPSQFGQMDAQPPSKGLDQTRLDGLWTKITGGESGGSKDPTRAKNPNSSAYGAAQFIDSTRDNFLSSPEAKAAGYTVDQFKNDPKVQRAAFDWLTKSNDRILSNYSGGGPVPDDALEAAHALGAGGVIALMQNPKANALQAYQDTIGGDATKTLITNNKAWGITPKDTASDALHKIGGYYNKRGTAPATASPVTPASPQVPSATAADGPTPPPATSDATSPFDAPGGLSSTTGAASFDTKAQLAGYQPMQTSDKMLGAAGAILQGGGGMTGLVKGLGMGIEKYQALGIQDQNNRFKIAHEGAQNDLLQQNILASRAKVDQIPVTNAQKDRRLDQQDQGVAIAGQRADAATTNANARTASVEIQKQRVDLANQNYQATIDGSKAYGGAVGKASEQAAAKMHNDTATAAEDMQQISDLRKVIGDNPNAVGGTYQAQAARFLADKLGIDAGVNPDANSVATKLVAAFNNQNAIAGGKGIGGRITQSEFGQFRAASAGLGTRPEAWKAMLDTYQAAAQRRLDISDQFGQLRKDPQAFRSALTAPGGLEGWYDDRLSGQNRERGITPSTAAPTQYDTPAGGGIIHRGGGSNGVPAYTVERM